MIQDITGRVIQVGDFVLYVTKTESPSLQFGWVQEVKDTTHNKWGHTRNEWKIKIAHSHMDGRRKNKEVWKYDEVLNQGGYEETETPSTAWLTSYAGKDRRFLVTKPI